MKKKIQLNNDSISFSSFTKNNSSKNSKENIFKLNNKNNINKEEEEELFKRGKRIIELFNNGIKESINGKLIINTKYFLEFENNNNNNINNNNKNKKIYLTNSPKFNSEKFISKKIYKNSFSHSQINYSINNKINENNKSIIIQKKNLIKCNSGKLNSQRNLSRSKKKLDNIGTDLNYYFSIPSILSRNNNTKLTPIEDLKKNLNNYNFTYSKDNNQQYFNSSGTFRTNTKNKISIASLKPSTIRKNNTNNNIIKSNSKKTLLFEEIASHISKKNNN